jgi:protein-disulfide isomerase
MRVRRLPATLAQRPDHPEEPVSDRSRQEPPQTRRARRAAERKASRQAPAPSGRSPIIWITGAALLAGVVLLVVLIFVNQPAGGVALTPPNDLTPTELADGRSVGAADAPVTLEVWADFQCPGCGIFTRATEARLMREYVTDGKLRLLFHDFAFIGEESVQAAIAARAAGAQNAFWPYHDWLFANQDGENDGAFRREVLLAIADELGLDRAAFEASLDDPALAAAVADETAAGRDVPVPGTPTLVLNGQTLSGVPSWDELAALIDAGIEAASGASPAP